MSTYKPVTTHQIGKHRWCMLLLLMFCMCFLNTWTESKVVVYKTLGSIYPFNANEVPTYFFESYQYFRGYIELSFDSSASQLGGSFTFSNVPCNTVEQNYPPIVRQEHSRPMMCLSLDLSMLDIHEEENIVDIKIFPQFHLNINPYTVRAYSFDRSSNRVSYLPMFPGEDEPTSLGPWQHSFKFTKDLKEITFALFACDESQYDFKENIEITYPRVVVIDHTFSLVYENASIVPPSVDNKPTVKVQEFSDKTIANIPEGYKLMSRYLVQESNTLVYDLDETRSLTFDPYIDSRTLNIDPFSWKCAYSFPSTGYSVITIDETSIVTTEMSQAYTHRLTCNQKLSEEDYVLTVIGKMKNEYNCPASGCPVSTTATYFVDIFPILYFSFSNNTQLTGRFSPYHTDHKPYLEVPYAPSTKDSLTLYSMFFIDFSMVMLDSKIAKSGDDQNKVFIEAELDFRPNLLPVNHDPYSFRLFSLNQERNQFNLAVPDEPNFERFEFSIDLEQLLKSSQEWIAFGVFCKTSTDVTLGDVTYINYPRDTVYEFSPELALNVYFRQVFTSMIPYSRRPFYTLNRYIPKDVVGLDDYIIIDSFMQQSGNNLPSYGFDEGRLFVVKEEFKLIDDNGNTIPFYMEEMRCAYLYQESNFKVAELSSGLPVYQKDYSQYSLNCPEDIRDENFVFMLISKRFVSIDENAELGTVQNINPKVVSVYNNVVDLSGMLKVSFSPSCRSTGQFTMLKSTRRYGDYEMPLMSQKPLTLLGVFTFLVNIFVSHSENQVDTDVEIEFIRNITNIMNLDPYSIRILSVDSTTQQFKTIQSLADVDFTGKLKFSLNLKELKQETFAIFAYTSSFGELDESYSIHYARELNYVLNPYQSVKWNFESGSFPSRPHSSMFSLSESIPKHNVTGYVIVKSFQIVQTGMDEIFSSRQFKFYSNLDDLNGNKVEDFSSLLCYYIANENRVYGETSIIQQGNFHILDCQGTIVSDNVEWYIIAKEQVKPDPTPTPTPTPSVNHTNPINPINPVKSKTNPVNPIISQTPDNHNTQNIDEMEQTVTTLGIMVGLLTILLLITMIGCCIFTYFMYRKKHLKPIEQEMVNTTMENYNSKYYSL